MVPRLLVFLAVLSVAFAGCKDREITTYRAPKDPPPALPATAAAGGPAAGSAAPSAAADQSMANTAVPTAAGAGLTWTAPAHWTAKPASAMRKGSYAVSGPEGDADLSITAFPGSTGGLLANINRWRNQLGLPALSEGDLGAATIHVDSGDLHLDVVDFAGTAGDKPTRILGAIVPVGSDTWFFKLMGPDALVAGEKPAFLAFLQTVKSR